MKPLVPFVSQSTSGDRLAWEKVLPEALSGIAEIRPFADLTDDQRRAATVAIVANPDPAEVAALPNLAWVQSLWAGVERLTAELPEDGPLIVRLTDPKMAETMSEAVLAWTLYLHRDMPRYMAQQRRKIWHEHDHRAAAERTVGILGLGNLGSASAQRLRANGFNVLGWSRSEKALDGIRCLHGPDGLKTVLSQSDITVLLMPLTGETRGMIGAAELQACKQDACLINFARGPILDTRALIEALDHGPLAHAVLDVFEKEPLPASDPLWEHEKVTVLPHVSSPTTRSTASKIVAGNIARYFSSGEIPPSVDRKRGY
ncbi:glyoxylate/hydroxypyruvate reductase A [Labrenzia sp. 011]|uniref:2-hydroxyacid dehydrogenase n=1 Tax=Labrenzia sp. 011 TaxID=2171494 RepID=UPI000D509996|nr:glyoxylate/hydroxypyruvate reductase A [Labrenzia sp. 011]PVB61826.1 glyoxylate/hydroxypyruvate reductase A [Labrenzia sp. 011]